MHDGFEPPGAFVFPAVTRSLRRLPPRIAGGVAASLLLVHAALAAPPRPLQGQRYLDLYRGLDPSRVQAAYRVELNQDAGMDLPPGGRELPGGVLQVACEEPPALVVLVNQLGYGATADGVIGEFCLRCDGETPTPDPATVTRLLFEGRTQVITILEDGGGEAALGPVSFTQGPDAGMPIMFDADTGPPGHAELDILPEQAFQSSNPGVLRDLPGRRVVFGGEAVGQPFDLAVQGRVRNLPATGERLGEVGAEVTVTLREVGGGSLAPLSDPRTTFTGPDLIAYDVHPGPHPENPSYGGEADAPGAFRIAFDFSHVADGTYEMVFFARDVQGNASPPDGENLVVWVVIDRGGA